MGTRILRGTNNEAVMYCSTTDWAFGPVFGDSDKHNAEERVESFLRWLAVDARSIPDNELESKYNEWLRQEDSQWKKEKEMTEYRSEVPKVTDKCDQCGAPAIVVLIANYPESDGYVDKVFLCKKCEGDRIEE